MAEPLNQFSKIGSNINDNFVNHTQKINFEQKYFILLSIYHIFNFIKYLIVLLARNGINYKLGLPRLDICF
jgi:hypothetical protein